SVGKAVGKAVGRNLVRRRLREILRKIELKQGWDVLFIARPAAAESKFQDLEKAVLQLLARAGLVERQA
ncbi:MAG: ribonuclease P protein component, partial [Chloroflexi bacterium]|nr:ribonuclease P protein component [Chloroflexota bacterium]